MLLSSFLSHLQELVFLFFLSFPEVHVIEKAVMRWEKFCGKEKWSTDTSNQDKILCSSKELQQIVSFKWFLPPTHLLLSVVAQREEKEWE